ncbi:tRNA (guanine(9)-N1)-methyltransferase-like protein [Wolffia australiana]
MEEKSEAAEVGGDGGGDVAAEEQSLSKSALKKQQKLLLLKKRKAERKAAEKEKRKQELEGKRREWDEKLAAATEEERARLVESRREARKERMAQRNEEREMKTARLRSAALSGHKLVLDLDFGHLMSPNEIRSLVHQIMYCYSVNGKSATPAHLWLTGFAGEIENKLKKLPGIEKWIIERDSRAYIDVLQHEKQNMVYLTADAEVELQELDLNKIYIIGGLVDRNRWKGITLKKAQEQGIQSAKLPIGGYLKMSSSKVLTVNQVVEILLKFLETKDWKTSFFQVIPQRKICEESEEDEVSGEKKRMRIENPNGCSE